MLDRHGLTGPSAHIDYKSLGEKWPGVLDAAHVVGHQYLVNPYIDDDVRKQPDGWKRAAETFNRAGEASQKAGIQFAYHNHWFEFAPVNGKLPYDILAGRVRSQAGEDGNGSVLDRSGRPGSAEIFQEVSRTFPAGAREGSDEQFRRWMLPAGRISATPFPR